ncbi:hypothetical protein [Anatilimnocola floriformis]|uniref:hypothetical protein n=1 Tax=Anatilimnocola floriformis TaxID=2948575 RepID=UPI0020C31936|nr:hypothetical protein [Anatilimnocola floriformis]
MTDQFEKSFPQLIRTLPQPQRLNECPPSKAISCLVAIAGFEPRCYAATEVLANGNWRASKGVCVCYCNSKTRLPNGKYKDRLLGHMRTVLGGNEPSILEHDDHLLERDFGTAILNELLSQGIDVRDPATHIVVDITVGSSRLLLEGLHALFSSSASVTVVYSEASQYRPYFNEYLENAEERRLHTLEPPEFLTLGVESVEVLRRIPGQNADARPAYLIMFPSFAYTRSSAVLQELAPSRVQWIFGIPHLVENRWRLDAQREYHHGLMERAHRQCLVSTFDYRETLEVLENIFRKRRLDYGVFVASLGSKMQKVGQVLFHLLRPEAAAVVSIPRTWDPERFSSDESKEVYSVSFGQCSAIRESLWKTRQLRL